MDDLRSEIRAAFEKEQAAHPPGGGLRGNLVAAAATQSRPAPNLQWIAVAVAAVLGILVVAGLMSTRLGPRANVPGNHKPTSQPELLDPDPGRGLWPATGLALISPITVTAAWIMATIGRAPDQLGLRGSGGVKMPDGSGFELAGT